MGRPGSTDDVRRGMASAGVAPEHCILGPELPDISSSQARAASAIGDRATLLQMLHPAVASWLLRRDGHGADAPKADAGQADWEHLPFADIRSVQRTDGVHTTMLRAVPDPRRVDEVWLPSRKKVRNGDAVEVLIADEFALVRTIDDRTVGFLQLQYVQDAPVVARRIVRRGDAVGSTLLRGRPDPTRAQDVWLSCRKLVRDGDAVDVLSRDCAGGVFSIVRTVDVGTEGYLKSEYLREA